MGVKSILRELIGKKRLSDAKGVMFHYGCTLKIAFSGNKKISYDNKKLSLLTILEENNYHVFRGYYDIDYLDTKNRFLCHRLPLNASNNKTTSCEVGYYDLISGKFTKIADTNAWCWQQGSRLRWVAKDKVIFNSINKNHYCAKIFDIQKMKQIDCIEWSLYDFTKDFKYGLSLNYSRLQRLRPGYGYNYFEDKTVNETAPVNDGLFLIDLNKRERKLIYSLKELAEKVECNETDIHYINHICISPSNDKFMFLHIYINPNIKGWKTVLYVANIDGSDLTSLEKNDRVSHYCWVDNDRLMITCRRENGREYYCIYEIKSKKKKILHVTELITDGHPSRFYGTNLYLTDTYPLDTSLQRVRTYKLDDTNATTIATFYHDYRLRGEKRCDLHPSIAYDGKTLSVDTTYRYKKRSIVIFKMED